MWNRKKKQAKQDRELEQMAKIHDSQALLLEAATSTADAAHDVTFRLKERLDDSLRQIETTSKLLADALIVCSDSGKIESFNPAAELIFGWKSTDVVGHSIDLLFRKIGEPSISPREILDMFSAYHPDALMNTPFETLRGKRKTGDLFWIDGSITHMQRMDGSNISMLLVRDVSTTMEMQRELKLNESRYRSVFEQSFDGIIVVQNYHIVAANPAITRVLGYPSESFIAKPLTGFFHKQSIKTLNDHHTARMNGDSSPKNYVVTGIKANGEAVELLVSSTLIKWETSNASLITLKDITEIRKLENDLGHATRVNNAFVNNSVDMFASYDKLGIIKRVNKAYLDHFGVSEQEVIGKNFLESIPASDRQSYHDMLMNLDAHRPTGRFQLHFEMMNGVTEIQDWIVHAIFDENGNFVEFQSLGRDLTAILSELLNPGAA
jgi:PAS domain S-box-containing protein